MITQYAYNIAPCEKEYYLLHSENKMFESFADIVFE